jgi:hypothetical protein
MPALSLTLYQNRNAFNTSNYIYPNGLEKTYTLLQVTKIAMEHGATAVCRASPNSKWYLRNQSVEKLMGSLDNPKNKDWPGMLFYIIQY